MVVMVAAMEGAMVDVAKAAAMGVGTEVGTVGEKEEGATVGATVGATEAAMVVGTGLEHSEPGPPSWQRLLEAE